MLPTFLTIGAPKSGTTSLHRYLKQHPDIFMSEPKEPHFFLDPDEWRAWCGPEDEVSVAQYTATQPEYEALFDDAAEGARGETSVFYYLYPEIIPRIRGLLPDAKIVVMLRDPVERAYSNYLHLRRDRREPCKTFEEGLALEDARRADGWRPFWRYVDQGMYAKHLAPWMDAFGDRMHVMILEEFKADPDRELAGLFRFLGVPDGVVIDTSIPFNRSGEVRSHRIRKRLLAKRPLGGITQLLMPKKARQRLKHVALKANMRKPEMKARTRQALAEAFAADTAELEKMLDRTIPAWHR